VAYIVASASGEYAMAALAIILQTLRGQPVPAAQQVLVKGARGKIAAGAGLTDAAAAAALDQLMQSLLQEIRAGEASVEKERES
jgi:hypothetical protein